MRSTDDTNHLSYSRLIRCWNIAKFLQVITYLQSHSYYAAKQMGYLLNELESIVLHSELMNRREQLKKDSVSI